VDKVYLPEGHPSETSPPCVGIFSFFTLKMEKIYRKNKKFYSKKHVIQQWIPNFSKNNPGYSKIGFHDAQRKKIFQDKIEFDIDTLVLISTGYDENFYTLNEKINVDILEMYVKIINSENPPNRYIESKRGFFRNIEGYYILLRDYVKLVDLNFEDEKEINSKKLLSKANLKNTIDVFIAKNDFYPIGFDKSYKIMNNKTYERKSISFNKNFTPEDVGTVFEDTEWYTGFLFASNFPYTFKNIEKMIRNLDKAKFCGKMYPEAVKGITLYQMNKKIDTFDKVLKIDIDAKYYPTPYPPYGVNEEW